MMGNYYNYWSPYSNMMGRDGFGVWFGFLFVPLILWSLVWKGLALWKSARAGGKGWFIALLLVNTLGILEILYIYVFSKSSKKK